MKIGDLELVVGARYTVDGQEMVLSEVVHRPYAVFEGNDCTWELWYGPTGYYTKGGWHGVDGDGPEDEDGAVIVKL